MFWLAHHIDGSGWPVAIGLVVLFFIGVAFFAFFFLKICR